MLYPEAHAHSHACTHTYKQSTGHLYSNHVTPTNPYIYIYIYIYIERERERDTGMQTVCVCVCLSRQAHIQTNRILAYYQRKPPDSQIFTVCVWTDRQTCILPYLTPTTLNPPPSPTNPHSNHVRCHGADDARSPVKSMLRLSKMATFYVIALASNRTTCLSNIVYDVGASSLL